MWYAAPEGMRPYRRCRAVTAGCSSSSSAMTVAELRVRADALLAAAGASDGFVVTDPARGDGAVEDPGRRCRTGEHQSGPTGVSRLGGRRGAGRAPRLLSARFRPTA